MNRNHISGSQRSTTDRLHHNRRWKQREVLVRYSIPHVAIARKRRQRYYSYRPPECADPSIIQSVF